MFKDISYIQISVMTNILTFHQAMTNVVYMHMVLYLSYVIYFLNVEIPDQDEET